MLGLVADLGPANAWIAAGFVRDVPHERPPQPPPGDVDVIWHDPQCRDPECDREIEARLRSSAPDIDWSVKDQARMHARNRDAPYGSAADAMRHWPETATAVAARRTAEGSREIVAPLGLDDLFGLVLRPGPRFAAERRTVFERRSREKRWMERWPMLRLA